MRSREVLANWLMCVAVNHVTQADRLTFTSDPVGGDGIILDTITDETWPTEHVLVPRARHGEAQDVEALILKAIADKQAKGGAAYARGKTLVVFLNAVGAWVPRKVAQLLPADLAFEAVWVVGLSGVQDGEYVYNVSRLDLRQGYPPVWRVRIAKDFEGWMVV